MDQIRIEDDIDSKQGNIYRYGRSVYTNIDILKNGSKDILPNGREIYRIMLHADDALALGVNFSEFWIPSGGKLLFIILIKVKFWGIYIKKQSQK